MINEIIVGFTGGASAALLLWIIDRLNQYELQWRESKRIYKWLSNVVSTDTKAKWRSTRAIASYNSLTEDRVRYLCSHHRSIVLSTGADELWGIKGISRDAEHTGNLSGS